jgi:hypothetical protein
MVGIPPRRSGMASGILSSQRALGSTAGFAIMGSVLAATVSLTLPNRLEPLIPDEATRDEVVAQVVDEANPQAVTSLIGPGQPLPDDVTQDDEILAETDDAFIAGIRVAMLVGFAVATSARSSSAGSRSPGTTDGPRDDVPPWSGPAGWTCPCRAQIGADVRGRQVSHIEGGVASFVCGSWGQ